MLPSLPHHIQPITKSYKIQFLKSLSTLSLLSISTMVQPNYFHLSSDLLNSLLTCSTYSTVSSWLYLPKDIFSKGNPDYIISLNYSHRF